MPVPVHQQVREFVDETGGAGRATEYENPSSSSLSRSSARALSVAAMRSASLAARPRHLRHVLHRIARRRPGP